MRGIDRIRLMRGIDRIRLMRGNDRARLVRGPAQVWAFRLHDESSGP